MGRTVRSFAVLCGLSIACAEAALSGVSLTTTSFSAAPIATIIAGAGIIPADDLELAADYLTSIANQYQAAIVDTLLANSTVLEKLLNPEGYYSYGRSPPVYPSPQGEGSGEWAEAYRKAKALVTQMTNEEKNNITTPSSDAGGCSGFTGSVPRLGFPGICLNDAESGVRASTENVNGYASQISVGASFDKNLAYRRAKYLGGEFKAKGINVALGPVVGPLGRIAKGGRNWEGFTNDPYLAGSLVDPTVRGLQESVIACVKHFIVNEQETNRNPFVQGFLAPLGINLNNSVSANLDDRTMHELYLWPFYDAVRAGAGSVMSSYNRINNSYGVQNSKTQNGLLKTELGFQGFILSDWYAQHTGVASANAGLDMVMPSGLYWGSNQLATAVQNGSINSTRLDDMATRILASWYRFAEFQTPGVTVNNAVEARNPAAAQVILQSAVEGHVLVKNVNSALPLKKLKTLSIFGYDATNGQNYSAADPTLYPYAMENTRQYTNGAPFGDLNFLLFFASVQATGSMPEVAFNGSMIVGGGSGAIQPTASVSIYDAFLKQAAVDGTTLYTDFVNQDPIVHPSEACLVAINAQSCESSDRGTLADVWSDTLVTNVANKCSNTIVVIHNAGIRLVDRFIDHENVTAVIYAHLPGQASGDALTEILYGRQSPSGRLPYTVAKNESDYGTLLEPTRPDDQNPQYSQSNFTEGVFIDYRHFIKNKITPRYPFGYGLTYTTFSYSGIKVSKSATSQSLAPPDAHKTAIAPEGGLASLYDNVANVTVTVANTGKVAAAEVAQLYIGIPNSSVPKALRGFEKYQIQPGTSTTYTFQLRRRDLSVWDVVKQQWMLQKGQYKLYVGKSVLDIQLTSTLCFSE